MEKPLPPPPALDVKCWTAGLHQQLLIRPGGLHPSEKARMVQSTDSYIGLSFTITVHNDERSEHMHIAKT